jgi:hypothetical protein
MLSNPTTSEHERLFAFEPRYLSPAQERVCGHQGGQPFSTTARFLLLFSFLFPFLLCTKQTLPTLLISEPPELYLNIIHVHPISC